MIQQISHHGNLRTLAYADASKHHSITNEPLETVHELKHCTRWHDKATLFFLAELYYQGFRVGRDSLKTAQYWQQLAHENIIKRHLGGGFFKPNILI